MATPRLWTWMLSPFAGKVRIVLAEKAIEVEMIEINPRKRPARLRELNPTNRVPVLEVDGVAVRESTAICEWAEETEPGHSIWPSDPAHRASARGMLRWVDDELTTNFFLSMRKEAFGLDDSDHPDTVAILRERLVRRWSTVDDLLRRTDGPWMMGGEEPTIVDLAAIPLAVRLPVWKPELQPSAEEYPLSSAWLETLRARSSAAEVDRAGTPLSDG